MQTSKSLSLARALFAVIGGGALIMAVTTLASGGGSLSQPVFPGGVALGILTIASAAWVVAASRWRAIAVWLGLLAVAVALAVFASLVVRTPSADVLTLFAIPAVIVFAAGVRLAAARISAGVLGD